MEGEDEDSGWVQMSAIDSVRQAVRLRLLADPSLAEKGQNHKGFHGDEGKSFQPGYKLLRVAVYAPNQHLYGVDKKIKGSKRDGASSTPATYTVIFDENGQPEPFVSALSEIRYTVETTGHDVIDFCIATGGGPGSWDGKRFRLRKQKNELQATKKKFMGILSQAQSSQVAPVVQTRAPTSAAALGTVAGTFDFSPHQAEHLLNKREKPCAHFVTVPVLPKSKQYKSRVDPHLLRFYFERKIGLKRPKVLLSLTGGAVDFDMTSEHKDKLLAGITGERPFCEASKSVDAWFVTGGTDKGIMKYVSSQKPRPL
ncbi:hypothetical protein T484DRAFT_1761633 [Baffinella frigidus]|nr:hypothetical protein T484DRAFT_1761633 [Cryptophyta sp. CCMP2293]